MSESQDLTVYNAKLKLANDLRKEIRNSTKSTFFVISTTAELYIANATLLDLVSTRYVEAGILDAKKLSRDAAYKLSYEINARPPFPNTKAETYQTALARSAKAIEESIEFIRSMLKT